MDNKLKLIIFSLSLAISLSAYFLFGSKGSDLSVETEVSSANCPNGSAIEGCAPPFTLDIEAPNTESSVDLLSSVESSKLEESKNSVDPLRSNSSINQSPPKARKIVVPKSEATIETIIIK